MRLAAVGESIGAGSAAVARCRDELAGAAEAIAARVPQRQRRRIGDHFARADERLAAVADLLDRTIETITQASERL